jgi:hypothetical protein
MSALATRQALARSLQLDREGRIETEPGAAIVRPLRDVNASPAVPATGRHFVATELTAVKQACDALGLLESKQRGADHDWREARGAGRNAELARLDTRSADLKAAHPALRGLARKAIIEAHDAAARRAGMKYQAACMLVGQAFAECQAIGESRDELLNTADFDPMGMFDRMALQAPFDPSHRAPGWCVTADAFGRPCFWTADSPSHREEVRRIKATLRNELDTARGPAAWPF